MFDLLGGLTVLAATTAWGGGRRPRKAAYSHSAPPNQLQSPADVLNGHVTGLLLAYGLFTSLSIWKPFSRDTGDWTWNSVCQTRALYWGSEDSHRAGDVPLCFPQVTALKVTLNVRKLRDYLHALYNVCGEYRPSHQCRDYQNLLRKTRVSEVQGKRK